MQMQLHHIWIALLFHIIGQMDAVGQHLGVSLIAQLSCSSLLVLH